MIPEIDAVDPGAALRDPALPEASRLAASAGAKGRATGDEGLRAAFDSATSGFALLDEQGTIRASNPALARMLGVTVAKLAGEVLRNRLAPDDRERYGSAVARMQIPGSRRTAFSVKCRRADALDISLDCNISRVDPWQAAGLVVEMHEAPAWRNSEGELLGVQAQMVQQEKMASLGQLAAGVAHEINNPLGYVHSNLGTLSNYLRDILRLLDAYQEAEDAERSESPVWVAVRNVKRSVDLDFVRKDVLELVAESLEGIRRMERIVGDLKDLSRAEPDDGWAMADLHRGLDSTLNIVNNEIKYKAIVQREYGPLPRVECRSAQINQVFMNLLVNASQSITDRGVIRVVTGVEGHEVWIDIIDNGAGIAPELLARIFDPFFTTKPIGTGTGLGLALSYKIVQRHRGRIEVDSEPGRGTRIRVWLPIRQQPTQLPA